MFRLVSIFLALFLTVPVSAADNSNYRINAGGDALTHQGNVWSKATGLYNQGLSYSSQSTINLSKLGNLSVPASLFQTELWLAPPNNKMTWSLPVDPGSYTVRLYFSEVWAGAFSVGKRTFDIALDGDIVDSDVDVFAEVGKNTALVKSYLIESSGNIQIDIIRKIQNPAIKGIEIVAMNPNQNAAPKVNAGIDQVVTLGDIVSLSGLVTDDGKPSANLTSTWAKASGPGEVVFSEPSNSRTQATFSAIGTYSLSLQATDGELSSKDTLIVRVVDEPPPVGTTKVVYRVNAGGKEVASNDGIAWQSNNGVGQQQWVNTGYPHTSNTNIDMSHASLPEAMVSEVFTSERWDSSANPAMSWSFPVDPGRYEVRLYFAEIWSGAFGKGIRTFNVDVEGNRFLSNYDVYAEVGANKAVMKSVTVDSDSLLQISFAHVKQNPSIKAIEIIALGSDPIDPIDPINLAPVVSAGADQQNIIVGSKVVLQGVASDDGLPEDGVLTINWAQLSGPVSSDIAQPDSLTTEVSFSVAGDYILELTAFDGLLISKDRLKISVIEGDPIDPINLAPVVSAGADQQNIIVGSKVILQGAASDDGLPEDGVLTINWAQLSGPASSVIAQPDSLSTEVSFSVAGDYILELSAFDGLLTSKDSLKVSVIEDEPIVITTDRVIYRVNAGGQAITSGQDDINWAKNSSFGSTGYVNSGFSHMTSTDVDTTHSSIPAGTPSALFSSERWAATSNPKMTWSFPVQKGEYEVRLYFAEIWGGAFKSGARVFDVLIEGQTVLNNLDVYQEVGANKGLMKHFVVSSDNRLDIALSHEIQNPSIKGIEIIQLGTDIVENQAPTVDLGANTSLNLGSIFNPEPLVVDDNFEGTQLSYSWSQQSEQAAAVFSDTKIASPQISFSEAGSYQLTLSVSDGQYSASDSITVTVVDLAGLPTLRINEFLAKNDSGIKDNFGDRNDWIEIINYGDRPVQLGGMYLTDDEDELVKWKIPNKVLPAGGYLLVFASKVDRVDAEPFHTNFNLKSSGEYLALVATDGETVIDQIAGKYPEQFADISYGRSPSGQWIFYSDVTPGEGNSTSSYAGVITIEPSQERGFFDQSFSLALESNIAGVSIYYTLDGSEPSKSNGVKYSQAINVRDTTVLRYIAEKSGYLNPAEVTHSYIFIEDVVQQPYAISGYPNNRYNVGGGTETAIHDYEMDAAIVQSPTYANDLRKGLLSIPSISLVMDKSKIFGANGFYESSDNEVQTSFEILDPTDDSQNQYVPAGIESHSWDRLKRSMRLSFKKKYGASKLDSEIMQNSVLSGLGAVDQFDRLVLRAGNNRAWTRRWNPDHTAFTIDQFLRDTQLSASGIGSHGRHVHLYINGIYWGLYNLAERPDDHFLSEYEGGSNDDWVYIKHGEIGSGDPARYNKLVNQLIVKNLANASNYAEVRQYLDVESFIDYLLVNWWASVSDWPHKNYYAGYRSDSAEGGATSLKYYIWDGEWSFDRQFGVAANPSGRARVHPSFLPGASVNSSSPVIVRLWHALRKNASFMQLVRQRTDELTTDGGALSDSAAISRWNRLNDSIKDAVVAESARWGDALQAFDGKTRTRNVEWQDEVNDVRGFLQGNAQTLKNALRQSGYY